MNTENQVAYTKNLTSQEAAVCMSLLNIQVKQKYTKKELQQTASQSDRLAYWDISEDQLIAAEKNPFAKKMWISIILLLGCCFIFSALLGLASKNEFLNTLFLGCLGIVMTYLVYKGIGKVLNFFTFRKARQVDQKGKIKKNSSSH